MKTADRHQTQKRRGTPLRWRAIAAIIRKDLKVVAHNKSLMVSFIVVPFVMLAVFPALAVLAPTAAKVFVPPLAGLSELPQHLPASLTSELAGLNWQQRWDVLVLVYFLAPVYLVIPLTMASSIAGDSFAGEKERKTLEALLYTPTTDQEIFLAKVLSPWLLAMAVALGGFVLYTLVVNLLAWPVMGRIFFPNALWLVLVLWVAPAAAALGLSVMVLISARAKSIQEANQLGSVLVVPLLLLMIGQATGVLYFNLQLALLLGLLLWIVDCALLWLGGQTFQRDKIICQL